MNRRFLYLCALALAGCGLPARERDLALEQRPDLIIALPCFQPGDGADVRTVRHDEQLPPPKTEENVDAGKEKPKESAPAVLPGQRLTLEQAVMQCVRADPRLKAAVEDVVQAQAELVTASTKPNPTLDLSQTLLPLFRAFTPAKEGGPPQLDVGVSYPIDWCLYGKLAARSAAARLGIDAAELDYADTLRQRVGEVALAYFEVMEARALLDLARQDVQNLLHIESTLEKAVKAGGKAPVDLTRVQLDRLRSEQTVRDAEAALGTGRTKLRSLLGASAADVDVEGSLEGEINGGEASAEEAFAGAVKNRPDVRAAQAQLARSQADVEAEDRAACPEVTPRIGYTHQFQRTTIGFPDADSWGLGVSIRLPCHDRNQGNRIKARSQVVQRQHEFQAKLIEVRAEVTRLVLEYNAARANARAVGGEQLRVAGEIRDVISRAYEAGTRSLLELLDAQRAYRETYRLHVTSRAGYYRAVYRLQNATGARVQR